MSDLYDPTKKPQNLPNRSQLRKRRDGLGLLVAVALGVCMTQTAQANPPVDGVALSIQSKSSGKAEELRAYTVENGRTVEERTVYAADEPIVSACISPFGNQAALVIPGGTVAVVNLDGSDPRELVDDALWVQWPASEGGRWIYYLDAGDKSTLRRVEAATGRNEKVRTFKNQVTMAAMSHDAEPDYGWMVMRGGDSGTYAVTYAMARGTGSTWSSPAWWQCFDRAGQRFSIAPDNTVFSMLGGEGSLLIIGMPTSDDAPAGYRLDPMNYRNRPHNWYTLVDWTMSRVADPHELRSAIRLDERLNMKQARFVDPVWAVNPPGWMLLTRQNLKGDKNDSSDIVLWDAVESAHHGIPSHAEVTANAVGVHDRAVGFWQRLPAEYSLGSHRGKVPFTVTFDDPRLSEERTWDFGDGSPRVKSKHPTHTYRRAGHFQVFAEAGAWAKPLKEHQQTGAPGLFRGKVMTLPPDPPAATAHVVDSTRLMIEFTEPMKAADATVTVDGDAATWALVDSGRRMTVQTSGKLKVQGRVALKGFTDRAQKPSGLAKETIDYAMPSWPSNPDRVVFRWEDVNAHNAVALPVGEVRRVELFRDGPRTGFDTLGRMDLGTGGMRGNLSASTRLGDGDLGEIVLGNAFSFECTFQPKSLLHHELRRPPRIVALSSHRPYVSLFMIGQQADRLLVSIKTIDNWMEDMGEPQEYMPVAPEKRKGSGAHPYGHGPWIEVAQLKDLEAHHLVVTYRPGEMIVYLDGREAFRTDRVTGDLDWGMGWMMFGTHHGLSGGSQSWHGSLEGVALYSRVLDAKEVARNAEVYAKKTKTRRREIEAAK